MSTLEARFERHLARLKLPSGPALVAVSGGPDSLSLLELLVAAPTASGLQLHVAHLDHGMAVGSNVVADAVAAVAARHRLPYHSTRLELGPAASETVARVARYSWLFGLADQIAAPIIFTAHHQDDQVETILMRLLKGSGPAGLAGIASRRGRLIRPLLPFRREELAGYLHGKGVIAWVDPANSDPRHQRSWIRASVLPALRLRLPDVDHRLLSAGRQAAADRAAWDSVLESLSGLDFAHDNEGVSVAATPLRGYDSVVVRALLGALGRRVGCVVGPSRGGRIERLLRSGRSGGIAELGTGYAAELTFGRLRLFRGVVHPDPWDRLLLHGPAGQLKAGEWLIDWQQGLAPDRLERSACSSWFPAGEFMVRAWRAGDRVRPLGGRGRRLVVRCMQDQKIARSRRAGWPVVEAAGVIVWVPGVCRSAELVPRFGAPSMRIDAHLA